MEGGVNVLTSTESVILDGAEDLLEKFYNQEISKDEFYKQLLELDTVYVDRSEFKDSEE